MAKGFIHIERRPGLVGILRSYRVSIDGEKRAKLREKEQCTLDVQPGSHEVVFKVDWCTSRPVTVHVNDHQTVILSCQSHSHLFLALFWLVFRSKNHIQVFQ